MIDWFVAWHSDHVVLCGLQPEDGALQTGHSSGRGHQHQEGPLLHSGHQRAPRRLAPPLCLWGHPSHKTPK